MLSGLSSRLPAFLCLTVETLGNRRWASRFAQPQKLRGALKTVPDGRANDPHVAFFLAQNPGHAKGDELVCLTELSDENLTRAGRRMVGLMGARVRGPVAVHEVVTGT